MGRLLTATLLLWEVPYYRILETLTSTDQLLGNVTTTFGKSHDQNRKNAKTQAAYSFGYSKHCQHLTIIEMQNLKHRFLEICIIIEVIMSQACMFIHFVLKFFYSLK